MSLVGAKVLRKEDPRLLSGTGRFVDDLAPVGCAFAEFVMSSEAHARIVSIDVRRALAVEGVLAVYTAEDFAEFPDVPGGLPDLERPTLARNVVRFVGEPVAIVVAEDRYAAADGVQALEIEYEPLPVVATIGDATATDAALLHPAHGSNVATVVPMLEDLERELDRCDGRAHLHIVNQRCVAVPIEPMSCLADWGVDGLTVWATVQAPHHLRNYLANWLDIPQVDCRVIAPDVGGGFGCKALLQPEEVIAGWLTRHLEAPVRWIEDRREHLVTGANCREHHYFVTIHATPEGRILGLDCDVTIDAGAYSVYPFTNGLEGAMAHGNLPGPYDLEVYRCRTQTMTTNKPPLMPYRGVARPGVCYAMEMTIDALAREIGMESHLIRAMNMVKQEQLPFMSIAKKHFDSGNYPKSVEMVVDMIGLDKIRAEQAAAKDDSRLIGVGMGSYVEQTAHGTSVFASWGVAMVPGYEQATVRLTPDGGLELRIGVQSHGQGMETSMAQMAYEVLGIDPEKVMVTHGDTGLTPYSTGTYASRSMVMAGGATARACRVLAERMEIIAAHLLQCERAEVSVRGGKIVSGKGEVSFAEIGRVWYLNPDELPDDVDQGGVEVTMGYRPEPDSGAFTYASHACKVAVDIDSGKVKILDYAIVEDCGTIVNPMIVEGQTYGGATQGIGTALLEESTYDSFGNPGASTFADYKMPGATDAPHYRIDHMESPSPFTEYGIKGMGEGGTIPTPAAIGNAINDALKEIGAEVTETPFTPRRILEAIAAANRNRQGDAA